MEGILLKNRTRSKRTPSKESYLLRREKKEKNVLGMERGGEISSSKKVGRSRERRTRRKKNDELPKKKSNLERREKGRQLVKQEFGEGLLGKGDPYSLRWGYLNEGETVHFRKKNKVREVPKD